MNTYQLILLGIFLAEFAFARALSLINYARLKKMIGVIPPEFAEKLSGEKSARALRYHRDKMYFGFAENVFDSIVLAGFLFTPLFGWAHGIFSAGGMPFVASGLLFFLTLTVVSTLLEIPFDLYFTFAIEKRYGFNTMTPGLWIADFFKSLILNLLFSSALLAGAFAIVHASPGYWWIILWAFFTAYTLFILYIAPYVIEPLFNKYKPLDDPGLEQGIRELLDKAGIKVSKILVIDASKRTGHTNAYFTGIGRNKRIVFYDTLLTQMDREEVLSVLAHEAGHWKHGHFIKRLAGMTAGSAVLLYGAFAVIGSGILRTVFPVAGADFFTDIVVMGFIGSLAMFFFTPLSNYFSRRSERQADRFAHEMTGSSGGLVSALVKLSADNLSTLHPHPWYAMFHYSHPPVLERIAFLKSLDRK